MRKIKLIAGVTALLGLLALAAPSANATVTGAVALTCTANLPSFPSPTTGSGTCGNGTIPARALGVGAGLAGDGQPYVVTGLGNFNASFTYSEQCPLPDVLPPIGTANGTANVTGLTAVHGSDSGASLSTGFSWTRVGLVAVIVTSGTKITFSPSGVAANATTNDAAVAAFAPLHFNPPANACPGPGASLQAAVAGADIQPA